MEEGNKQQHSFSDSEFHHQFARAAGAFSLAFNQIQKMVEQVEPTSDNYEMWIQTIFTFLVVIFGSIYLAITDPTDIPGTRTLLLPFLSWLASLYSKLKSLFKEKERLE